MLGICTVVETLVLAPGKLSEVMVARQVYSPTSLAVKVGKFMGSLASCCPREGLNGTFVILAMADPSGPSKVMSARGLLSPACVATTQSASRASFSMILVGLSMKNTPPSNICTGHNKL